MWDAGNMLSLQGVDDKTINMQQNRTCLINPIRTQNTPECWIPGCLRRWYAVLVSNQ